MFTLQHLDQEINGNELSRVAEEITQRAEELRQLQEEPEIEERGEIKLFSFADLAKYKEVVFNER